jgi:hypothetical protein
VKAISTARATASARAITVPGHLVEIDFATPVYLSSLDQVNFNGHTFVAADVRVSGLSQDARGRAGGNVTLGNGDLTWSALILGEGVADRRIKVWSFDWTALGAADIVPAFDGVGDSADVGQPCVIRLTSQGSTVAFSPRRYIGLATGFRHLSPCGRVIQIGSVTMMLERPGATDTGAKPPVIAPAGVSAFRTIFGV